MQRTARVGDWLELERELDRWADSKQPVTLWWRDDDAARQSPALKRLLALSDSFEVPLGLAVVPAAMTPEFAASLPSLDCRVQVLQHGFEHRNNAGENEKKTEFGEHRPMPVVRDEIARGAELLKSAAPDHFLSMFVPPWNRISKPALSALPDLGFQSVSTFGPRKSAWAAPNLRRLNTHVDLIDWRCGRRGKLAERVVDDLVGHLQARRCGDIAEPTGILSHHFAHDEQCWEVLDRLFVVTRKSASVRWLRPGDAVNWG
ncbi:MAG TPA: polysaccharide deacetylase family protein [Gammaproteobacteria bacterium]